MADTKLTGLTAATAVTTDDLLYVVDDPGGTPASKKITVSNFMGSFSGIYTPTLTNTTNIASSTPSGATRYIRIGNIVFVSGWVAIDTTAAGNTVLRISLPIASNLDTASRLTGTGNSYNGSAVNESAQILAESTTDTAEFKYYAVDTGSRAWSFNFAYQII